MGHQKTVLVILSAAQNLSLKAAEILNEAVVRSQWHEFLWVIDCHFLLAGLDEGAALPHVLSI
jgi:hypothetical protein